MARFAAAKMNGAIDVRFQRAYNDLIDLLDTGYHVQTTLDGVKIAIKVDPKVGLAFYQGDTFSGGLQIINSKLFMTSNAIKGPELDDRYMLWEDSPGVLGFPNLQLYDDNLRVGIFRFDTTSVGLAAVPTGPTDPSEVVFQAYPYVDNPENFVSLILYGNKGTANYAEINVWARQLTAAEPWATYSFTPTGMTIALNGVSSSVWTSGSLVSSTGALSYNAGFANPNSAVHQGIRWTRLGNIVILDGAFYKSDTTTAVMTTLPTGVRPTKKHIVKVISFENIADSCNVEINTDGTIEIDAIVGPTGLLRSCFLTGISFALG